MSEACKIPCHKCIDDFDIRSPFFLNQRLNTCRMILCDKCGNKRCPRAENHRFKCTNSNKPWQVGVIADEATESKGGK